ncbi:MAG TPA: RNA methyltransferase [Longimicrobiales bacterium]|nr:RNA methyltransferase [Longimicrobiales bacterium]
MLSRAELKRLRALKRPRGRADSGLFLAEGVRVVEELLASGAVPRIALLAPSLEDTARGAGLARRLRDRTRTVDVDEQVIAELADTETPQGVVVAAAIPRGSLAAARIPSRASVVVLDGVQDPGNFGTIVRSADAFAAALVIALPGTVDPWNAKSVRAAAGSSFRVPVAEATLPETVSFLRTHGLTLFGADMNGTSIEEMTTLPRMALALGNEGAGLTTAVRAACDTLVAVPIRGAAESLNVGVAAGILLYMLSREQ